MNVQARIVVMVLTTFTLNAQWVHRYPQVTGLAHHIYLEGHELPGIDHGCLDPAPAPNGKHLYFTGMGWIWRLDLQSGEASRITQGPACDSRPAVSRDGKQLVFLRDDTHTIWIVMDDGTHSFTLKRAALGGGRVEEVPIRQWDWGVPTTTLTLRTLQSGKPVPARMEVVDGVRLLDALELSGLQP